MERFTGTRETDIPVDGRLLREQAIYWYATEIGLDGFTGTNE